MSNELAFRPRFRFRTPLKINEIAEKIKSKSKLEGDPTIKHVQDHLILTIPAAKRHYFSPQMDISLEIDAEENLTLVRCLIGPMPTVWTMFMFFYGFFGFVAFVGLTLGMSQWTLEHNMWGFWLLPVAFLGMLLLFFVSLEGKKLAKQEMLDLKVFVDEALDCDCFQLAETTGH